MKFCCDKFQFHYQSAKEMGLNFRIIKLSQGFINRGYLGNNVYRYLITDGYSKFDDSMKRMFIEHCPFCGKELRRIYDSDKYVNEINHDF